jgi:hypothetical protein
MSTDKTYREIIEEVLSSPVNVVIVDVPKEFIYLDKTAKGWKLTMTRNLLDEHKG